MKFCTACGATLSAPGAPAAPHGVAAPPRPAPAARGATPAASSGSPILKIVLTVLCVIFVLSLVSVGAGVYYYYHHIKPKVAQIEKQIHATLPAPMATPPGGGAGPGASPNSAEKGPADIAGALAQLGKMAGANNPAAPGGGASNPAAGPNPAAANPGANPADMVKVLQQLGMKVDPNNPLAKLAAAQNRPDPHFPALTPGDPSVYTGQLVFQPGMTIAESISEPLKGDYDVLITIRSVSEKGVTENFSAQLPANRAGATSAANAEVMKSHELHTDEPQDLLHATNLFPVFAAIFPEVVPGSTKIVYSQDAYRAIKSGSGVDLTFGTAFGVSGPVKDGKDFWASLHKYTCHDARLEAGDAAFPVLLNGKPVILPAIHESCPHSGTTQVGYFLDDEKMALILAATNGQITQINYPQAVAGTGGQSIEQALKKEGHVDVYGIYFDFASDKLRPESGPVLDEIAAALKNNPTWKLHVNGHTDNIGGDPYNLDLSNRRAAAVKQALVTKYQIDPARLDPKGFGATQPKESNDTLQGRARNRRVELVRE
jgi:outer membrane protein OmpA-like peptidoglycan-associated protein